MQLYVKKAALAAAATLLAAGCSQMDGTIVETRELRDGLSLVTGADVRTINRVKGPRGGEYITCAEPSPDVAKAVGQSLNLGGSLGIAGLPSGIDPQVAAAISQARAESVAQLGERLATIQLLRDGLYRACEAYANGAISETAYAIMLSRYDDTMVTMMLGEIAGGAFGRSLAGLGSEAQGTASASLDTEAKIKEAQTSSATLKSAQQRKDEATGNLDKALASGNAPAISEANDSLERAQEDVRSAEQELSEKLQAAVSSAAKASATVAGAIEPGKQSPEVAKTLATMQRKYVENINTDALEIACVSALDKANRTEELSVFGQFCLSDMLPVLQENKKELLALILERAQHEKDYAKNRNDITQQMKEWQVHFDELEKLKGTIAKFTAP